MAAVDADGSLRGDRRTRGGGNDPANGDEAGSKRRCTCRACLTGGSGDVFDGGAPSDPLPDTDAEVEYPEQRCETVQSSPYYDRQLGGAAADGFKTANAPADLENGSPEAEYYCETAPIGESGEEGSLLTAWYGPVVLELYGAGATDYVTENGGVKADDAGAYYVPIGALRALPEGLSMTDAQAEALTLAPAGAEWVLVYPNDDSEVPQP